MFIFFKMVSLVISPNGNISTNKNRQHVWTEPNRERGGQQRYFEKVFIARKGNRLHKICFDKISFK